MKSKWIKGLTSVLSIGLVAVIVSTVIIRGTLEAEAADTLFARVMEAADSKERERIKPLYELEAGRITPAQVWDKGNGRW